MIIERYLPGLSGGLSERLSFENILILVLIITIVICIYLPFVYRFGFSAVITGGVAVTAIVIGGFWIASSYLISSNTGLPGLEAQEGSNVFNALINNNLFYSLKQDNQALRQGYDICPDINCYSSSHYCINNHIH